MAYVEELEDIQKNGIGFFKKKKEKKDFFEWKSKGLETCTISAVLSGFFRPPRNHWKVMTLSAFHSSTYPIAPAAHFSLPRLSPTHNLTLVSESFFFSFCL